MSTDPRREFTDRIRGAIFGCALGDALALPAEGAEKRILEERYPDGLNLPHKAPVRDFPLNDWTDDTDSTVLIMRSFAGDGNLACAFARQLVAWFNSGFPELGDKGGAGCGNMTWRVLRREDFVTDPFAAAIAIIGPKAGNGALMRTAPCAFMHDPASWASYFCRTTHSDPRCVATCIAQSLLIRAVSGLPRSGALSAEQVAELLRPALVAAKGALAADPRAWTELKSWVARSESLEKIEIGSRDARGYTYRSFACSLWAFRQLARAPVRDGDLFKRIIREIAMEGGDADTNAAIAGALLGAAIGYEALPADWIAPLPNRDWLLGEVDAFIRRLGGGAA